ncbi:ABC transporter substrate-binding protein [Halostella sp. PRR32]|uniref:ABC transporter substrate-binding protein n=1 Tax=Halostella sp. PRR32 TaxID=3098147 RepID=UPI002B1D4926|nr:ABC transporter substrate-binding protein [Halostella sp. PRR32]
MSGDENASGNTIKVGVMQPLTGPLGSVGEPARDAAVLPAQQVNDADIEAEIDIQTEDTQTDPQAAVSAAQSLVDADYPAISGPLSTATTLQVLQNVCKPNQIAECTLATAPTITDVDDNDLLFRTSASDALMSQAVAQLANEGMDVSSISTFAINDSYGQSLANAFADAFDGNVLEQVSFESGQSSYTSKLTQALSGDPDALFIVAFTENGIKILRDFYSDFSSDTEILATSGIYNPAIPENVNADLTNITGVTSVGTGPSLDHFNQAFNDEYGSEPGQFTWQAYDATATLMLANAAADSNDGAAIKDNMRQIANPEGTEVTADNLAEGVEMAMNGDDINYQGVTSDITFDDNGDVESGTYSEYWFTSDGALETGDQISID